MKPLDPKESLIIISDMWDRHWCEGMKARVTELAAGIKQFIQFMRDKGGIIAHCPTNEEFYTDHPSRQKTLELKKYDLPFKPLSKLEVVDQWEHLNKYVSQKTTKYTSQANKHKIFLTCHRGLACYNNRFMLMCPQIGSINIDKLDYIIGKNIHARGGGTALYELNNLIQEKKIKNVLLTGVALDICLFGKDWGVVQLRNQSYKVFVVKDLIDIMPDHRLDTNHTERLDLVLEYVEDYYSCPAISSSQLTGVPDFKFSSSP